MRSRKTNKDPRIRRLEMERELLEDLCNHSDLISYEAKNRRNGHPPENYTVTFNVRSIVGIDDQKNPIYGDTHIADIKLPSGYPMTSSPICYMRSDIWHPNIRSEGKHKGHICINAQVLGHWHTLDMLVEQIGEMLQYKNYHAIDIQPYPEDSKVAEWIREVAEPRGIVNKAKGVVIDDRPLLNPTQEWLDTRKKKIQITILGRRKNPSGIVSQNTARRPVQQRPRITVSRKPQ